MTAKKTKNTEDKIKKLEEQKAVLAKKIRLEKNKLNAEKRKKRTKRLIEKGAILEKIQGKNAENVSPEETLRWLEMLQNMQDVYEFMVPHLKKWRTTNKSGVEMTVEERLERAWNVKMAKENKKHSNNDCE